MVACLVQIDAYDPVAGAAVTLFAASHDDQAVCHLNGQTWWPALLKLPVLRYDWFDGGFGGTIDTPSSSLTLAAEPWPNLGRYSLADARLRLWTGTVGDAWAAWTLRFDGRVTAQPKIEDGRADIAFSVDDRWLDQALLATFAGTTGVEGPAGLKGQVKPLALGAPAYVAGTLIDSVNSVFQISAYGGVQAIGTALERLARFGASAGDYASYTALIAATLPAGAWATCKATGLARFGAPPTGQVSLLVSGDNSGTDGWARKPGQLIRRLALLAGGTGKVDDASLNALDTARPYNLSLYLDGQATARDTTQKLAASVNAVAGVSWTGQLFVAPVAIGAATITLAADGSSLPPVSSVQQLEQAPPYKALAMTAERAWTVHQLADIAFTATLVDVGAYAAATTYREGNIVELPSGARFMYSAITPTAGNSPPNTTYWTLLPAAAVAAETGGNLIRSPVELDLAEVASGAFVETSSGTNNRDRKRINFPNSSGNAYPEKDWTQLTVKPGETLYFSYSAAFISGSNGTLTIGTQLFDSAGGFIGTGPTFTNTLAASGGAGFWRAADVGSIAVPSSAAMIRPVVQATGSTGAVLAADFYFGRQQPGADVTAASQVTVDGPATVRVGADSAGAPLADTTIGYKRLLGTTDVSASTTWSIASSSGCTISVGSTGVVTRSGALGANGKFTLRSVRDGVTKDLAVSFIRDDASPPTSTGGGGSGGASSGNGDVASATTSNTYGTAGGESAFTCVAGSGGQVALTISLDYSISRNAGHITNEYGYAKLQWRAVGGTWADVATETASDVAAIWSDSDGSTAATIYIATTKTGLTGGTTYEFRCLFRRGASTSGVIASASGTLSGVGS